MTTALHESGVFVARFATPFALGLLLAATACSKSGELGTGGGNEASSGDEASGMAKKMPATAARSGTPQAQAPAKTSEPKDFRPKIADAPPVQAKRAPAPPTGPSPWGAPDAESGKPLPTRPKMNSAALAAYTQGLAAAAKGDNAGAKAAFEKALAADSRAYQAAYNLGVIADRQGQTNQALQYYSRALTIEPDYEDPVDATVSIDVRQGHPEQAVAFAQPIATAWVRNLYLQAILAHAFVEANRLDDAEQAARKALRRDERFVPAMVALAEASIQRGRKELADSILEQALTIDANYAEVHFLQGKRHQQEGRAAQALTSYSKAVQLRPDYAEARMALGTQYMAAGNYALALEQFEALSRLAPTLVAVHLNLGDAYRANRRWQDSKRELDQALRMQDKLPEAHFNLGLLYMDAGAEFPGLQLVDALQRASLELTTYREQMGSRLTRDDPAAAFIADLQRQIDRERKRIDREKAQKQRDAERAARAATLQPQKPAAAAPPPPAAPPRKKP
jgi:tetratricopeptide (TPR) repeat protein